MTDREFEEALRRAIPPVGEAELRRDLWPAMLGRMEARAIRFNWLDWALAGALALVCALFPHAIPALLYNL